MSWMRVGLLWLLCCLGMGPAGAQDAQPDTRQPQVLRVYSRSITTLAGEVGGYSPRDRAEAAEQRIEKTFNAQPRARVSSRVDDKGAAILLGGQLAFYLRPADINTMDGETLEQRVQEAVQALELVREDLSVLHNPQAMAKMVAWVLLATAAAALALKLLWRLRRWALQRLRHWVHPAVRWAGVVAGRRVRIAVRWVYYAMALVFTLLALGLVHAWLSVVLHQIPYTRAWSLNLNSLLWEFAQDRLWAVLELLPNLLIALVILLAARYTARFVAYLFGRIERGDLVLAQFDRDTAATTRRLLVFAVWVFALAMAYPYLPGAQTEAFKGLSVMIGLMVSLGASSLVGQFASGLILIYSRALKVGEYVQIGEVEGTVAQIGLFATKLHTNLREEVNIPNSGLVGEKVKNFSRLTRGGGVFIAVNVTAGYDTPWRQVEAMLLEVARETPGVRLHPAPKVLQKKLSDTCVEYELRVAIDEPKHQAAIVSLLHGKVQDVFARQGVAMLSPQYIVEVGQEPPASTGG